MLIQNNLIQHKRIVKTEFRRLIEGISDSNDANVTLMKVFLRLIMMPMFVFLMLIVISPKTPNKLPELPTPLSKPLSELPKPLPKLFNLI